MIYLHSVPLHKNSNEAKQLLDKIALRRPLAIRTSDGAVDLVNPHLINLNGLGDEWVALAGFLRTEDNEPFTQFEEFDIVTSYVIDVVRDGISLYLELCNLQFKSMELVNPDSAYERHDYDFFRTAKAQRLNHYRSVYYDGRESGLAIYDYVNCVNMVCSNATDSAISGLNLVNEMFTNALASFKDIEALNKTVSNDFTNQAYLNMTASLAQYFVDNSLETNVLGVYRVIGQSNDRLERMVKAIKDDGSSWEVFKGDVSDISTAVEVYNNYVTVELSLPNIGRSVHARVEPRINPLPKLSRVLFLNSQESYIEFLQASLAQCKKTLEIRAHGHLPAINSVDRSRLTLLNTILSEILSKVYAESEISAAVITNIQINPLGQGSICTIEMTCDDSVVTFTFN